MFTLLYLKLFWKGYTFVGPNKEIRITRTFEEYGEKVYDIIWCFRDKRTNYVTRLKPEVIVERCNKRSIRHVIDHVEKNEFPKALKRFQEKLEEQKMKELNMKR